MQQLNLCLDPLIDLLPLFLGTDRPSDLLNVCWATSCHKVYAGYIKELGIEWKQSCKAKAIMALLDRFKAHLIKLKIKGLDAIPSFSSALHAASSLQALTTLELHLNDNGPGKKDRRRAEGFLASMASAVRSHCLPALESLRVDRGQSCDVQISILLEGFKDGACPNLKCLVLPHLYSDDEWVKDFERVSEILEARQSLPDCKGLSYIDLPFSYLPASLIIPIMQVCLPTLELLEWEHIDHPSIIWDYLTISGAPALREIWLQVDSPYHPTIPPFVNALHAEVLPGLAKLVICGDTEEMEDLLPLLGAIQEGKCAKLTHLRFFPQGLKDTDIAILMNALTSPKSPKHLSSLIFGGNVITEGMKSIAVALVDCNNLPNLEILGLDGCPIRDDGLNEFCKAFSECYCSSSSRIEIYPSQIGDSFLAPARGTRERQGMHMRRKLKIISMEDCGLGDGGVQAFASILSSSFPCLKEIRLDRNPGIGKEGIKSIIKANVELNLVTLAKDHLVDNQLIEIVEAMKRGDWDRVKAYQL